MFERKLLNNQGVFVNARVDITKEQLQKLDP